MLSTIIVLTTLFYLFFLSEKSEYTLLVNQPEIFNEINSYLSQTVTHISFSSCKKLFNFPSENNFKRIAILKLYNTERWVYDINISKNFGHRLYFSKRNKKMLSCGYEKWIIPLNISFEAFKTLVSRYEREFAKYKLLASFSCNKGNISLYLFKLPNNTLLFYGYYYQLPDEKVPGGFTVREWFRIDEPHRKIIIENFLTSIDSYAYFNLTIMPFRDHYCNPDFPIIYKMVRNE